jgi:iron complex outermembrane receptor protein
MYFATFKHAAHHPRRRPLVLCLGACLMSGGLAAGAQAQQADAGTGAGGKAISLDAITVTSTKRATNIQQTPLAVSAITAEAVSDAGITSTRDVVAKVPGLSVQDNGPGATRLSMRGIYSAGEATTSLYYDETPVSGSVGSGSDAGARAPEIEFFDVERIEALRGPQGTLYGSGSMGGAIRVIFQKPKLDVTEGTFQAGYATTKGGDPSWNTSLMLNTPLVENVLGLRLTATKSEAGGYVDNLRYGEKNVDYKNSENARVALRYQPTDTVTLDASVMNQKTDAILSNWSPGAGVDYGSMAGMNIGYEDHTRISNLTLNWDLDWATLTASSSYFDSKSAYGMDSTYLFENVYAASYGQRALDFAPIQNYYPGTTTNWSNELRLASNGGSRIDWTAGLFSENRKSDVYSQHARGDKATGYLIEPNIVTYSRHIDDQLQQSAAFGEATWHITDRLDLTAGLRWYHYEKTIGGATDLPNQLTSSGGRSTARTEVGAQENGWLKKINASYRFTPEVMAYLTVADGMRPGGANQNIPDISDNLRTYKGDQLWNYELGVKSQWFDRRLFANVALYQIDWEDMQVSAQTNPVLTGGVYSFVTNAGKARLRGAEWELTYRPLAGLDLGASFNYIDAKLSQDQLNNAVQASSTLGVAGDRIPNIPRWTAALYGAYRWSLSDHLDGMLRVDGSYVGTSYTTFRPNDPARVQVGNYTLINARFGVEDASGKWATYLYVNNLADKVAFTSSVYYANYYPYGNVVSARPRTIGIDVKYNF